MSNEKVWLVTGAGRAMASLGASGATRWGSMVSCDACHLASRWHCHCHGATVAR